MDDLSKKKRKVKKEPESRKRKSEGGEDRGERAAKRGRGKNSYSEVLFDFICFIVLSRLNFLLSLISPFIDNNSQFSLI